MADVPRTADVVGPIPEYQGLHADFGWSGHAFKHSPAIGDIMAESVLEGHAAGWDLTPFRWSRFRDGDLLPPRRRPTRRTRSYTQRPPSRSRAPGPCPLFSAAC